MGVYAPHMKMPKNCAGCFIRRFFCQYEIERKDGEDKPTNCPLVDIPTPHGDLIDFDEIYLHAEGGEYVAYFSDLKDMPTWIGREE